MITARKNSFHRGSFFIHLGISASLLIGHCTESTWAFTVDIRIKTAQRNRVGAEKRTAGWQAICLELRQGINSRICLVYKNGRISALKSLVRSRSRGPGRDILAR